MALEILDFSIHLLCFLNIAAFYCVPVPLDWQIDGFKWAPAPCCYLWDWQPGTASAKCRKTISFPSLLRSHSASPYSLRVALLLNETLATSACSKHLEVPGSRWRWVEDSNNSSCGRRAHGPICIIHVLTPEHQTAREKWNIVNMVPPCISTIWSKQPLLPRGKKLLVRQNKTILNAPKISDVINARSLTSIDNVLFQAIQICFLWEWLPR